MSEIPKKFWPLKLTKKQKERLEAWAKREEWTREKTLKRQFGWEESMPRNLVAPEVPPEHWSGKGKCVCVMCGYTTSVTNIHRQCPELPADAELTTFRYCEAHKIIHTLNGGRWATHRSINMVAVS